MPKIFTTAGQYGVKRSGKFGKLSPAERAELNIQKGLYDDPAKVTKQMKKDLDALLKETRKNVNDKLKALQEYADKTGRVSPSMIPKIETPDDIQRKIEEIARGKIFEGEETSTVDGTKDFFDAVGDDVDELFDDIDDIPEYGRGDGTQVVDRWNILRRIIQLYPEYTQSEILDMVDYLVGISNLLDNDEITEIIINQIESDNSRRQNFENSARHFR